MAIPNLAACVINFNGERYLEETLAAVRGAEVRWQEVLLVDNASTDRSLELVAGGFPEVRVLRQPANLGAAAARNAGFRATAAELVLFIDNDVRIAPDCPAILVRALGQSSGATLAMPRVLYAHAPDTIQYDGAGCHFTGVMTLPHQDRRAADVGTEPRPIDSLVTACFLVDRRRWGERSLFDEAFSYLLEDHDLGMRARILGHGILVVPAARCFHGEGTPGLSLRETGRYTPVRIRNHIRNRWLVLLKNYQLRTLLLLAPGLALFEGAQLGGAIAKGWLGHWLGAARDVTRGLPRTLGRRREIQRQRRVPDREILCGGPTPFNVALTRGRIERLAARLVDASTGAWWRLVRGLI